MSSLDGGITASAGQACGSTHRELHLILSAIIVAALLAGIICISILTWYTVSQLRGRKGRSKFAFAAGKVQLTFEFEVEHDVPRDDPRSVDIPEVEPSDRDRKETPAPPVVTKRRWWL
jgi:hypothetical protein